MTFNSNEEVVPERSSARYSGRRVGNGELEVEDMEDNEQDGEYMVDPAPLNTHPHHRQGDPTKPLYSAGRDLGGRSDAARFVSARPTFSSSNGSNVRSSMAASYESHVAPGTFSSLGSRSRDSNRPRDGTVVRCWSYPTIQYTLHFVCSRYI